MSFNYLPFETKIEIYYWIFIDIPTIEQVSFLIPNYIINKESILILKETFKKLKQTKTTISEYHTLFFYEKDENIIDKCITCNEIYHKVEKDVILCKEETLTISNDLATNLGNYLYLIKQIGREEYILQDKELSILHGLLNKIIWNESFILVEIPIVSTMDFSSIICTQRLFYKKDAIWSLLDLFKNIELIYNENFIKEQVIFILKKIVSIKKEDIKKEAIDFYVKKKKSFFIIPKDAIKIQKTKFQKNNKECTIFKIVV